MKTLYLGWENGVDNRDRVLHIFSDHAEFMKWVSATDGLREWNTGARYMARDSEVVNHSADHTIFHGVVI